MDTDEIVELLKNSVKPHRPPPLPPGWEEMDEYPGMGVRYKRTDGLRVISSLIRLSSVWWFHVSACRAEGGIGFLPSDEDLREVRRLFIMVDARVVKGDMPGSPRVNPAVVHLWASMPGERPVPWGELMD